MGQVNFNRKIHGRRRIKRRAHKKLNKNLERQIILDIERGRAEKLGISASNSARGNRSIYRVKIGNKYYKVIYLEKDRLIITVLKDTWRTKMKK